MIMVSSYLLCELAVDSQILELVKPEPGAGRYTQKGKSADSLHQKKSHRTYLTMK